MGFLTIFYKYIIQQYFTVPAPNTAFMKYLKQIKYQMLWPVSQRVLDLAKFLPKSWTFI